MIFDPVSFIITLTISLLLGEIFKADAPPDAEAGEITDNLPTIGENESIPVLFGTALQDKPILIGYGTDTATAVTRKIRTSLFSSTRIIERYRYGLNSIRYALCYGSENLQIIRANNKNGSYNIVPGYQRKTAFETTDGEYFYALDEAGGNTFQVASTIYTVTWVFHKGLDNHNFLTHNSGLITLSHSTYGNEGVRRYGEQRQSNEPEYRGIAFLSSGHAEFPGNSQILDPIEIELKRIDTPIGSSEFADIQGDMNPAICIYEILTNKIWGGSVEANKIDLDSFNDAIITLSNEQIGYSAILRNKESAQQAVSSILSIINGVLTLDRITGLIKLKLLRGNYDISTLDTIDDSVVLELAEYQKPSYAETINEVQITFINRAGAYQPSVVSVQDIVNLEINNNIRKIYTEQVPGIKRREQAERYASNKLLMLSSPLIRGSIICSYSAFKYEPGDVVKLNLPQYNINNIVIRIAKVQIESPENDEIRIDFVEDNLFLSQENLLDSGNEDIAAEPISLGV